MNQDPYDSLETRSAAARAADLAVLLPRLVAHARASCPAHCKRLEAVDPRAIRSIDDLRNLPVLRKSDLMAQQEAQRATDPFAGYAACGWSGLPAVRRAKRVFQSPGRIYEPQGEAPDALRAGRALFAAGFRAGDLVHNSFSYHLTPAGAMMELEELVRRHPELLRGRLVVEGQVSAERLVFHAEVQQASGELQAALAASIRDVTKLRADVVLVPPGCLADDGKVIDDRRSYH
ncbi:MAG TPA: hypothetical protein VLK85_19255 [Ramlibacter sp.]|nr:hypothetical protein [Ramlibacter sp.]